MRRAPLPHDLIQARGQLLAHSLVSDYLQHWRPSRRRWPAGYLPVDHLGRYAAPSFRSRLHNSVSYVGPTSADRLHRIREECKSLIELGVSRVERRQQLYDFICGTGRFDEQTVLERDCRNFPC